MNDLKYKIHFSLFEKLSFPRPPNNAVGSANALVAEKRH